MSQGVHRILQLRTEGQGHFQPVFLLFFQVTPAVEIRVPEGELAEGKNETKLSMRNLGSESSFWL